MQYHVHAVIIANVNIKRVGEDDEMAKKGLGRKGLTGEIKLFYLTYLWHISPYYVSFKCLSNILMFWFSLLKGSPMIAECH